MSDRKKIVPIPARLLEARKKAGFTTVTAAEMLHMTRSGISVYESGKAVPTWPVLKMMALLYGTNVEWLCGESDDPLPDEEIISVAEDQAEQRLLAYYRYLKGEDRDLILNTAKRLADLNRKAEKPQR